MLQIECPNCGPRSEIEFRCAGEGHIVRPGPFSGQTMVSDKAWAEYLFFRDNPRGVLRERWVHAAGCGRWFNVARHTVTHKILAVYAMTEICPVEHGQ